MIEPLNSPKDRNSFACCEILPDLGFVPLASDLDTAPEQAHRDRVTFVTKRAAELR